MLYFLFPMKKVTLAIALLSLMAVSRVSGQKKIAVDDIYTKGIFSQQSVYGINWMNDGRFCTSLKENQIVKTDIVTGEQVAVLADGAKLRLPSPITEYHFSADETKILLLTEPEYIYRRSHTNKAYLFDFVKNELVALSENRVMYPTFSPNGTRVAYVRENNLYYLELEGMREVQVTRDGIKNKIINGASDWAYEEEFYITRAFEWSPDGSQIAYYKFDESPIREYHLQKWNQGQTYPEDYVYKYPKAGTENSLVSLHTYHLHTRVNTPVEMGDETEFYIPKMVWTKASNTLAFERLNRKQNRLELLHAHTLTGRVQTILVETSDTYIDLNFCEELVYLEDGVYFLISSERDGHKHLYRYRVDGTLVNQVTRGDWEVDELVGIDQAAKHLYYISTENSPLTRTFYRISMDGTGKRPLFQQDGVTQVDMSPDASHYIAYYSNHQTPLEVTLFKTEGPSKIAVLETNEALRATAQEYDLAPKEFFQFQTREGQTLHGYLLKPKVLEPHKKYPLLIYQYSGPGSQNVMDSWAGSHFYWHQMLVQQGYAVAYVDPTGTGGRGAAFKKKTYRQLGRYETQDIIEASEYLGDLPFVDKSRIGVWGWSYGGFISSLSMFWGNAIFKAGIAVAPVTDYRFYDTIYTERYMDTPQNNPRGYEENAPLTYADQLQGHFLLIHGTGDDNVHVQNAIALQDALITAGKQFETFYYPDRTHSMFQGNAHPHLFTLMQHFILKNL